MIRIAAVGDVHVGEDCAGCLDLAQVDQCADLLLLAGDLTRFGALSEAEVLADEVRNVRVPVVAVLGNHDYQSNHADDIIRCLQDCGVHVLEGDAATFEINGRSIGIAGTKGFGGGFMGACASDFGEPEMKAFVRHTKALAQQLETVLESLHTDTKIVLLHYAPTDETLRGERPEIYPFLGSYLLGEAIDRVGADLVFHGHAHRGSEQGVTAGGVPVRNVAKPVIGAPFKVYSLNGSQG